MSTTNDILYHMGGVPVMSGIPFGPDSKAWFVAPGSGSDSNSGTTPKKAFRSLSQAHTAARANKNDVVFMMAESNSASGTTDYQTATLTWSKDMVHLVGINAGGMFGSRSRIATATVSLSPLVNITANACVWQGIHVFHGVSADQAGYIAVQVTGDRNVFRKCHFAGGGVSTTADDAAMRSLKLSGASESLFEDCVIGLDTIDRSTTANAELEFDNGGVSDGCARNVFRRCTFVTYGSGAHAMVLVDADGIDRFALFDGCTFINPIQSGTTALTECFSVTAGTSPNGAVILKDPLAYGCGPWEADVETGRVIVLGHPTPASTDGSGLAGAPESP